MQKRRTVDVRDDAGQPRTRLEGQCPRCRDWFDADPWFDHSAPLPCCPACGLPPDRLAYVSQDGERVERLLALDGAEAPSTAEAV